MSKNYTSLRGLTLHNGRASMVAFATSSASSTTTVCRQDGTVSQLEPKDALDLLNSLTAEGFDYMVSHGRTLQALCSCEVTTADDGTVTLSVTGTISWCTGHTGFPVNYSFEGACVEDLLKSLTDFYEDFNTRYVNKVDLCNLNGSTADLAGLLGRTRVLNDSDNRSSVGF
mgnify:FL=1